MLIQKNVNGGKVLADPEWLRHRWGKILTRILIALPILSLVLNAISWLRFGIDLPYFDDWRAYHVGEIGTFNLAYLFKPANDTLYPVGLALDSLAYIFLDGNTIAYQFISMVSILGMLLILQWRLLLLALGDKLLTASAFCFTLLMLQPDSYWGLQNLAYHQAIPLICGLAAIYIVLGKQWGDIKRSAALGVLGLISGFVYISGAFLILVLGIFLVGISRFIQMAERQPLAKGGWTLIATSAIAIPAQLWVIVVVQHGTHRADAPLALPYQRDFWLYLLGKISRSLLLPTAHPLSSLILTCFVSLIVASLALYLTMKFISNINTLSSTRASIIFLSLCAIIVTYLMLIAAGRTNLRPTSVTAPLDIFTFGYIRFHFFWVTVLWPWLVAIIFVLVLQNRFLSGPQLKIALLVIMPMFILGVIFGTDAFKHSNYYQSVQKLRLAGLHCIISEIQKDGKIDCPEYNPDDLSSEIHFAEETGASFMRNLPIIPITIGTDDPKPLFRFSESKPDVIFNNVGELTADENSEGYKFNGGRNSEIYLKSKNDAAMRKCTHLEVSATLKLSESDLAKVFYIPIGQEKFIQANSKSTTLQTAPHFKQISFEIFSATGFMNEIRFNPVTKPQVFVLNELEIRCRKFE
ncbi:MAG: hypothetical protein V4443_01325 [Pseudomonadota bacterium]